MPDKKMLAIIGLLALLLVASIGWFNAETKIHANKISYDNTYNWTEYFHGYEAYLDKRIYRAVMVTTSMTPTINVGDTLLWVEIENFAELRVGDIIIYKHPTLAGLDNIAHRIVEIVHSSEGYKFRTKGDNLLMPDQHLVPESNVRGLVIGVIYGKGRG
jgi:signal peptidase I